MFEFFKQLFCNHAYYQSGTRCRHFDEGSTRPYKTTVLLTCSLCLKQKRAEKGLEGKLEILQYEMVESVAWQMLLAKISHIEQSVAKLALRDARF